MTQDKDFFVIRSEVKQAPHLGHCSKNGNSAEGVANNLEISSDEGWHLKDWGKREEGEREEG